MLNVLRHALCQWIYVKPSVLVVQEEYIDIEDQIENNRNNRKKNYKLKKETKKDNRILKIT